MSKLSLITINRNNAEGLRKTLASVVAQTYRNVEHIIVDGGSTDGSVDVIREYEKQNSLLLGRDGVGLTIKWLSEPDKGIYDAMNKGIEIVQGRRVVNALNRSELVEEKNKGIEIKHREYCLFLNSGDVLANDNVIENWLRHDLKADIIACNAVFEQSRYQNEQLIISPEAVSARDLILSFLPHQATFIRRQLFTDIHLYDTSFKVISDWLFFIEAILVRNASYQHINMFVARCETEGISNQPQSGTIIDEEFTRGLKKVLPLYYDVFAQLRQEEKINSHPYRQYAGQMADSRWMQILWGIRKRLINWGYFQWKARIKQQIHYANIRREDAALKRKLAKEIESLPLNMLQPANDKTDIILSLTSYGRRVADTLPYTLLSIFRQSRLPNRVVLWLDQENWRDDNLPSLIKRLQKSGLEVRYCEDIKSYKKLIPALRAFPHNPIIVVDDDSYYDKDLVRWLVDAYEQSDKRTVFATCANIPEKRGGKYIPYSEWKGDAYADGQTEVALIGCGGGIYPPDIFDNEILRSEIFMSLVPTADDLWFWVQEKRRNISVRLTPRHGYHLLRTINRIEDMDVENADNLTRTNVIQGKNNKQLFDLIDYYKL